MLIRFSSAVASGARRVILRALCLFLCALPALAVTVTPIIDENVAGGPGKKVSGKIDYINDTLQPLQVVLDTKSFSVSDTGEMSYRALDPDIHLKLSEMSFRIAPRQTYTVFYEVSADKIPAWCVVYAAFSGFKERTKEGFKIQVQLPHT